MKRIKKNLRWVLYMITLSILCSSIEVKATDDDCPPAYYEDAKEYSGEFKKRYGDYEYTYCEEYEGIVIVDYFGKDKVVRIPKTIDGYTVKELANNAFSNSKMQRVIIPDSVIRIGDSCFSDCTKLKKVKIPEGVLKLKGTFYGCTSLKEVILPQSLFFLEAYTLARCTSLKEVIIPDKVQLIGVGCFSESDKLQKVNMPTSLRMVKGGAFRDCKSLKQIIFPEKTVTIEERVFKGCTSLKRVELPPNILKIEDNTFQDCKNLKQITIPKKLHYIEKQAFYGCSNLKKIKIKGTQIVGIEKKTFEGIHKQAVFDVPKKAMKKYKNLLDRTTGFVSSMKVK